MKFLTAGLAILLACFYLSACKKSSTNSKIVRELIAQGSWEFDNAKVAGIDMSAFIETCQKDNNISFSSGPPRGGTQGFLDEGPTKCNSGDPQTITFSWDMFGDTVLSVSHAFFIGGNSNYNVVNVTETQLVLSQVMPIAGAPQNTVITFIH
jgi:Lipocalin-like domain